jgi:hypothetical protein
MSHPATYELAHAELALKYIHLVSQRRAAVAQNRVRRLPEGSQAAADQCYLDTARKLYDGLAAALKFAGQDETPRRREILRLWQKAQQP